MADVDACYATLTRWRLAYRLPSNMSLVSRMHELQRQRRDLAP
jgi:hypothetical protein